MNLWRKEKKDFFKEARYKEILQENKKLKQENRDLKTGNPFKRENEELDKLVKSLNDYCFELERELHSVKAKAYRYDKLIEGKDLPMAKVGVRIIDLDETIKFLTDLKCQMLKNRDVEG